MNDLADGIYFGMADEVYHALPRIGSGGLSNLLVSAGTFWAGSWLNPKKAGQLAANLAASTSPLAEVVLASLKAIHPEMPEPDAEEAEESTKAQLLGKAYHTARLEPEKLEERFARAPDKSDFPRVNFVANGKEVEAALAELGQTKKTKDDKGVADQARRLRDAGFTGTIWPLVQAEFAEGLAGRTAIPAELWEQLIDDMELIRSTPEVAELLTGGAAEVSVLYHDEKGIPRKARLDYLRVDGWVDFKTFANPNGKHLEQCIADAFQYNRYHIQAADYRGAVEMIRGGRLEVQGEPEEWQRELIEAIQLREDELACHYVYQEKGGVPNLLAKRLRFYEVPMSTEMNAALSKTPEHQARVEQLTRSMSLWLVRAHREIRKASRLYRAYAEIYEPGEKWRPFNPVSEMTDMDFRTNWLDEEVGE
jgi:hypothetical protein